MKKNLRCIVSAFFLLLLGSGISHAQVAALPFTASLDTFNVITGTTLDAPGVDDVVYQGIPIGFTFNHAGTPHDYMSVNTNGYVELDSTGTNAFYTILSGARNNIVAPFGADLKNSNANASLQYVTIGTAPNRITIVQWLHYSYFVGNGDVNIQLWLFETSNCIKFIYGNNSLVNNPLNTQIGMRGTTNADFIALGDTVCNWANAYPYPSITTMFPVSLSCNMPSGFAFHFGPCVGTGSVNFSYLTGTVFNDVNGNGSRDTLEPGIPNRVVNLLPGNYFVSTDAGGNYAFFYLDSTLTYTLSTGGILYWVQTTTPAVLSCNPQTQSGSGLNFGFQQIPNVHEVSVTCPNWGAKPGQPEPMPISFQNNGTATESDTITFVMDSLYTFISSNPAPAAQNGQTIQWAYSNLAPGQHNSIMLYLLPDSSAVLGNYLNSTLSIGPSNDTVPANNVVNLHQLITLAWDPNEKLAEPSGEIDAGTEINYTIHFQNTGNATADNVTVYDTLDAGLDLLSFRLTGSSHTVNFTMEGNGVARFTFYNIQLPDSGADLVRSNGYVSFAIRTLPNLPQSTSITNRAGIVFDWNPPVMTNTTQNSIRISTGLNASAVQTFLIKASPNPALANVVFEFPQKSHEPATLNIHSIDGKTVMIRNIFSGESTDLGFLPSGIYLCTITTANSSSLVKLIKE
ncbi:MAG TPA: T9SS type A sorting domain-containing protein [Bacteroidia bacterium]|nr:T9SS type A sorting domain-containing protein [Bacteroidia bacterium]